MGSFGPRSGAVRTASGEVKKRRIERRRGVDPRSVMRRSQRLDLRYSFTAIDLHWRARQLGEAGS